MLKEEDILFNKVGKQQCFQVPEGYFERMAQNVMSQIPENDTRVVRMQPSFWRRLPIRQIAAAVGVACVLGAGGWYALTTSKSADVKMAHVDAAASATSSADDDAFDQMADYAMIDNETIYASLLAEN